MGALSAIGKAVFGIEPKPEKKPPPPPPPPTPTPSAPPAHGISGGIDGRGGSSITDREKRYGLKRGGKVPKLGSSAFRKGGKVGLRKAAGC